MHFCIHCKECIFLSFKKTAYDSNKAENHLKRYCNASGKVSIQQRLSYLEIKEQREKDKLLDIS